MALEARGKDDRAPRRGADLNVIELETAKEILAEEFHTRPGEVEEMIQRRLEKRSWHLDMGPKKCWLCHCASTLASIES